MTIIKATVALSADIVVNLDMSAFVTGYAFLRTARSKMLAAFSDQADLITRAFAQNRGRFNIFECTLETPEGLKTVVAGIPVATSHDNMLPAGFPLSAIQEVFISYNFYVRARARGQSVAGGRRNEFVTDVVYWAHEDFQQMVNQSIGENLVFIDVQDNLVQNQLAFLRSALFSNQLESTDPMVKSAGTARPSFLTDPTMPSTVIASSTCWPLPVVLCAQRVAHYSNVALPILLSAVQVDQLASQPTSLPSRVTPAVNGAPTLNALIKHGCEPLNALVVQLQTKLNADPEKAGTFETALDVLYQKLLYLNRRVTPREKVHCQRTNRLVIHEFLAAAAECCKKDFALNYTEFSNSKGNRGHMGYGPLDAFAHNLILAERTDPPVEVDVGEKRDRSHIDSESEEASEDEGQSSPIGAVLDDNALAQALAGGVDIVLKRAEETPGQHAIAVCLCTAHRYIYFAIEASGQSSTQSSTPLPPVKPVVRYLGDVSTRVLRSTDTKLRWEAMTSETTPRRATSHCFVDEFDVDRGSVEKCLTAMVAVMSMM